MDHVGLPGLTPYHFQVIYFYRFQNCKDVECCVQPIKVCKSIDGSRTVSFLPGNVDYECGPLDLSLTFEDPPIIIPCQPTCAWLGAISGYIDITLPALPISLSNENSNKDFLIQEYDNDIYLTLKEKNIVILTRKNLAENIVISFFTTDGRILLSRSYDALKTNKEYILKIPNLSTGMYFYTISSNGVTISSGSIPIVK